MNKCTVVESKRVGERSQVSTAQPSLLLAQINFKLEIFQT